MRYGGEAKATTESKSNAAEAEDENMFTYAWEIKAPSPKSSEDAR